MVKDIRVDLRIARSKSGLSGKDMAHLMGCGKDRISKLENGAARLTAEEMVRVQLIFGSRFEETFGLLSQCEAQTLFQRIDSIPAEPAHWAGKRSARLGTLDRLSQRLQAFVNKGYER